MRRKRSLVFILLGGLAIGPAFGGGTALAQGTVAEPQKSVIVTRGQAIVKRAPDQAWVTVAAEARAASSAETQRNAAEAMNGVMAALTKAGLPADAVRTTGYALQPDMQYENGRARVRGYIARNQIEVRVDDLAKLPGVLDAAGSSGATTIAGLRFEIKDRATVEREALRLAVQDAMARARAIAAGAAAQVGPIVRIDEESQGFPPPMAMARMTVAGGAAGADTPITPGEIEVRAQVTVTVSIR